MMPVTKLCWLSLNCLLGVFIHQTGSQNPPANDILRMDSYKYDKNSLACAMICRVGDTCDGFSDTTLTACQCESMEIERSGTNDEGTFEPPIPPQSSLTQGHGPYVIYVNEKLYWYGAGGKLVNQASLKLAKNVLLLEVDNPQSPKILYWMSDHRRFLYSADILSGKYLKKIKARYRGLEAFKVDRGRGLLIWTTNFSLKRCTLEGHSTALLYKGEGISGLSIDRIHRRIYFADWNLVQVINYDGSSLRKIFLNPVDLIYYNEADDTLYWMTGEYEEDNARSGFGFQKQHPLGPERIIFGFEFGETNCFHFTVHNKCIFFKTDTERGISALTLYGKQLQNLGTDIIATQNEAQIIFL